MNFSLASIYCIIYLTCFEWKFACSFLNIEELQELQYSIDILKKPLNSAKVNISEGLQLASKHGQQYFCKLPNKALDMADQYNNENRLPIDYSILKLLEPLKSKPCLKIVKGWWTYEFCYMKFLHQYHNDDGKVNGDIISLGLHESDFNWNDESQIKAKMFKKQGIQKYHTQYYVNGTKCEVLNHKRDSEVRYYCDESATYPYIERVDEPSTCSYIITVKTHLICSHPHTRLNLKSKPADIVCQPILEPHKFQRYNDQQTKSILQAYEEANVLLKLKRERLRRLLANLKTNSFSSKHQSLNEYPQHEKKIDENSSKFEKKKNKVQEIAIGFIQEFATEEQLNDLTTAMQTQLLELIMALVIQFPTTTTADLAHLIHLEIFTYIEAQTIASSDLFSKMLTGGFGKKRSEKRGKSHVQVKIRHVTAANKKDANDDDDDEQDETIKELEDGINKELEKTGAFSDGTIEVHLVSSNKGKGSGVLSNIDTTQFKEALLEIMGGTSREQREKEKFGKLVDNYNIKFVDATADFVSKQSDNDDTSSKS